MSSYKPEEVQAMERKGYMPISLAAERFKRSRARIDKLVQIGKIEFTLFKGVKWVKIKDLRGYYEM